MTTPPGSTIPAVPAMPPPVRPRPAGRRHRGLYWGGVLAALAALAGGTLVTVNAYLNVSAPESTATAYFHALARGDAAGALALGDVPAGPRTYLTADVLHAALAIARISDVRVLSVDKPNGATRVLVQYQLDFAGGPKMVTDSVRMVRHGRGWRLAATAASVHLAPGAASARLSIAGAKLPSGPALFFPGALPVSVDTPNLQLNPQVVHLGGTPASTLRPVVSHAGAERVVAAVSAAVRSCLAGKAGQACPPPADSRTVPGSVHGTLSSQDLGDELTVALGSGADGLLDVTGLVDIKGTYTKLDFDNLPVRTSGSVQLSIDAHCYATDPTRIVWGSA